ncbi:MAG: D-alanine--D-alanine ligase [Thiobacillaceae bacterium]|nr:D-alanine--D-alanine ligase [Thiobacillaceae bacterium]MCX7672900.1 D-alanine--D-alanine ligase [Thiobacillaceae bacterium]MDW8322648.1 D-alanine--D-alanine ligase [Burkholderiales bacterium]
MDRIDIRALGRVGVVMGGRSAEREISLKSGAAVLAALERQGVDVHAFDPAEQGIAALERAGFDRVFVILHGRGGEDGTLQGALELMRIPYTGSGVLASALGMDKWRCKLAWQGAGLPVPDYRLLTPGSDFAAVEQALGLPLFVKPACEGSSVGVSKVKRPGDLQAAYEAAARHDRLVLAERYVAGGEYTVAILGEGEAAEALPVIRIEPATEFYDYEAKYFRDDTRYLCPCGLPAAEEAHMQRLALAAYRVLGCRGWARVDILRDEVAGPLLLEINTAPGMTDHSLVPMAARAAGIGFDELCLRILASARLDT